MQVIPNLGTFSKGELSLIQNHLSKIYTPKALVSIKENLLFQILQQSKRILCTPTERSCVSLKILYFRNYHSICIIYIHCQILKMLF
nr:unnamed protein product [Callosobruchus analis]